MSSAFNQPQNTYPIAATASHVAVAASIITALYFLTGGWVW